MAWDIMVALQVPTRRRAVTSLIYLVAALADSWLWATLQWHGLSPLPFWAWLCFCALPLVFAFAYPEDLFSAPAPLPNRSTRLAMLHGSAIVLATVLFAYFATPNWENPLAVVDGSTVLRFALIAAVIVFLVAALSFFLKEKSSFAVTAALLFWPYLLAVGLVWADRFFETTAPFDAGLCFLCFVAPVLFAFAAGTVSYRPRVAHVTAFATLAAVPWLYLRLRNRVGVNVWLMFNVSDKHFGVSPFAGAMTILSIAIITVAIATAILRLIPMRWRLRDRPICERSWPAFGVSLIFLGIWYSQSVMPYRIPEIVDGGIGRNVLQILHVQKRGLQFHESCVSVGGYRTHPLSVYFSQDDRRLFEYRFQDRYSWGSQQLSEPVIKGVQALIYPPQAVKRTWDRVTPLRSWNADAWYVRDDRIGLRVYRLDKGTAPPQQIVDLFNELLDTPRSREGRSEIRDVCLGFCYDPLSALGDRFVNQRCRFSGGRYICQ